MKVVSVKHIEDCFDGSTIMEVLLSSEIYKELIFELGKNGDVQYFDHFARPFFKIRVHNIYDLKGIEGNSIMRIHLKDPQRYTVDMFRTLIEKLLCREDII